MNPKTAVNQDYAKDDRLVSLAVYDYEQGA